VRGGEPLEIERDPDPIGRAAAKIAVQFQRSLPRFLAWPLRLTLAIYCKYTVN
jgi:hypothetical protein